MAVGDRSLSAVFQDIVGNIQEIVRSEVRLAKREIKEEATKAKAAMLILGAGAVSALFAMLFLLTTTVDALALVMPHWAAALIVGSVLAVLASLLLTDGLKRFKQVHPPTQTVETIKENIEWAKQQIK